MITCHELMGPSSNVVAYLPTDQNRKIAQFKCVNGYRLPQTYADDSRFVMVVVYTSWLYSYPSGLFHFHQYCQVSVKRPSESVLIDMIIFVMSYVRIYCGRYPGLQQ